MKENFDFNKFVFTLMVHFPKVKHLRIGAFHCGICEDLREKHCAGKNLRGQAVFDCMAEKVIMTKFYQIDPDAMKQ